MSSSNWLYVIIGLLIFGFVFEKILEFINTRNWKKEIPLSVANYYDRKKYEKARLYHKEKGKIALFQSIIGFCLTLSALAFGWFGMLDNLIGDFANNPFYKASVFFVSIFLIGEILSLPFSIFNTFVIEEKYGFNKTTIKTYVLDKIKGYLLTAIIGGGLLYLAIFTIDWVGQGYWLWLWIGLSIFMLLINMFYADFILPLFNKLTQISDGDLKDEINKFALQVGYSIKNIYIIDGSKRSTKGNAFFSGIGPRKTIALFDTLIEKHTKEEIVAILAHEIGHYKKKHILISFVISIFQTGLTLFLLEYFLSQPNISLALGATKESFHIGIIAFGMIFSPLGLIIGIGMNILSRKNEFEADAYAKNNYDGESLSVALKKLSVDSLSNLYPHKAYVFVHHSHPPLLERLKQL
jgi:STE24 endopeptidase